MKLNDVLIIENWKKVSSTNINWNIVESGVNHHIPNPTFKPFNTKKSMTWCWKCGRLKPLMESQPSLLMIGSPTTIQILSNKNVCIFDFPWQDYKKTQKITWLAVADKGPFVPCICVQYDHIISKAILGKEEDFKQYVNRDSKVYVFSWYVCKHPTIENGFFFSWFVCPFVWHLIQFLLFSILCSVEQQLN